MRLAASLMLISHLVSFSTLASFTNGNGLSVDPVYRCSQRQYLV